MYFCESLDCPPLSSKQPPPLGYNRIKVFLPSIVILFGQLSRNKKSFGGSIIISGNDEIMLWLHSASYLSSPKPFKYIVLFDFTIAVYGRQLE